MTNSIIDMPDSKSEEIEQLISYNKKSKIIPLLKWNVYLLLSSNPIYKYKLDINKNNSVNDTKYSISDSKKIKQSKLQKLMYRTFRILKWLILMFSLIISLYIVFTIICNIREERILDEYDLKHSHKMEINGHLMSYSISGEKNNNTIVVLNGMGCPSPITEFKPLAETLSDKFKVITLEPLGYGFSDRVETNRTIENSISELHECTKKLGVDKYHLMGHSMGGFFCLEWATKYSDEVLGVIGLDSSVSDPKYQEDGFVDKHKAYYKKIKFIFDTRIPRIAFAIKPSLLNLDYTYNYTEEEIKIYKYLSINRSYSKAVMEDAFNFLDNLKEYYGVKYSDNIPVIHFVSGDNVKNDKDWETLHYDTLGNNTHNEVIVLDGPHYIHFTQRDFIAKKIKEWIN